MFILMISKKYNIDESHDISHSMDVLHFANDIYEQQVYLYTPLKNCKNVIQICALLHDHSIIMPFNVSTLGIKL